MNFKIPRLIIDDHRFVLASNCILCSNYISTAQRKISTNVPFQSDTNNQQNVEDVGENHYAEKIHERAFSALKR